MAEETRREEETTQDVTDPAGEGTVSVASADGETAPAAPSTEAAADEPAEHPASSEPATAGEPHTMAEIDEENLEEPEEVLEEPAAPPEEPQPEEPFDVEELREVEEETQPQTAAVTPERKLGPLTPSMWFLVLSVIAFIFSFFVALAA